MEHGPNLIFDIAIPSVNFLIFVGVLYYVLRKPLKQLFVSRSEEIEKNIKNSMETYEQARERHEKAQKNLTEIEEEKKRLYLRSEAEIEAYRKKSEEELRQTLGRLKSENEQRIDEELRKTRLYLKEATLRRVFEVTEFKLKKDLDKNDHQRLADEYVEELFR
jgi:F-type H+-transporting ATPase subunit b